jgi:hypothetical protein
LNAPPNHFVFSEEKLYENFWEFWDFPRQRCQLNASVSHHADEFLGGSHDFKFGIEAEISSLRNNRGYPGGRSYEHEEIDEETGEFIPYSIFEWDGYDSTPTTTRLSAFVQDTWSIGERLTINPGLRINYWKGNIKGIGKVFEPKIGIAPRIGFTFDIFGDHSTALKAHYGKYYHGLMGMFYLHLAPTGTERFWVWGDVANMWAEEEFDETGEWPEDYPYPEDDYVLFSEDPWEQEYTVDPDLRMAYMNQFVFGIEREIFRDLSVGVSFIYRSNHDFMDKVNLTGEWEQIEWEGWDGVTYTVYERLNPGENQYYITNPKAGEDYGAAFPGIVPFTPSRKYRALEFTLTKRYSHRWQLQASYVYGKAWGSDDNTWGEYGEGRTSSLGASILFSNPNNAINAQGRLGIDPTHMVKITGSWFIPHIDVSIGFHYSFETGSTYTKSLRIPPWIDDDNCGAFPDDVSIFAEERGSYRYPDRHNLDLRLEKIFKLGKYRLGAVFDIFNVFNDDTTVDIETELSGREEQYPFGTIRGIRRPITFRLGLWAEL